ncbi:RecQ family ATP-dependent DNA helicase [Jeotgalibacillus haloalkalitolerans]|uniref:ATP-dependent DNA helicase RecQ n=1 Tax=Jeotgalibacillus haloalkalitolerans TaxID=3104292 RepID=A0ABU5KLC2_9BACL|nr:RecQ family ATP-dependent DNA helicase [Jeotgalibacillus sp. HH7-29]MDZ5712039.1 RecQ family ATP-dependent DNA helicase [Jeotgalibacillus sp. HH7-29]
MEALLEKQFGYTSFRTGQKEIIQTVLNKQDTIAMLPTGTGKSLCYQYPSYVNNERVLIISPLLSLMQDQVDQIKLRGEKRAAAINSFLSFSEKKYLIQSLEAFRFIFLSPEMLTSHEVLKKLKEIGVGLLVVDEAHCISQWGPDFRPDYLKLDAFRQALGNPCTLALTATATEEIRRDIADKLGLNEWKEWVFSVNRPNIALEVIKLSSMDEKESRLLQEISSQKAPGIVFFSSKKKAEELQAKAGEIGIRSAVYHGDVETDQRILIQQQFITGQLDWIFATNAFGMGINKENIRTVIHFHMPSSIENFLQEIGRAGRDGDQAHSILLYSENDVAIPLQLSELEKPDLSQIEGFYSSFRTGKSLDLIQQDLMLSDTQLRVLGYYAEHIRSAGWAEEVERILEERVVSKRRKVLDMKSFIETEGCRREKLLSFFDEKLMYEQNQCCDRCGLENIRHQNETKEFIQYHWKEKLSLLLNGGTDVQ